MVKGPEEYRKGIVRSRPKTDLLLWLMEKYPNPMKFRSYALNSFPDADLHPTINQWLHHYIHAGLLETEKPGSGVYSFVDNVDVIMQDLFPDTGVR